jgi:hypothetical protein
MAILEPGNVLKNNAYLGMMKRNTLNPRHPRHNGIKMQAHHVLSANGIALSRLGARLVKFGYDINLEKNLVFIPCTLQGACYLGVQPHRGNHTTPGEKDPEQSEDEYDDDADDDHYHELVSNRIIDEERKFPKRCKKSERGDNQAIDQLNALALRILGLIQNDPKKAPLTSVAKHFDPDSNIGCAGHDSVGDYGKVPAKCAVERNHLKRQREGDKKMKIEGQKKENITFVSNGKFQLRMGN